jgi:hypothetical protein
MADPGDEAPQEPNRENWGRRESDDPDLSEVDRVVPGRRGTDFDPRLTISRKAVVVTVVIIDALYIAGQAIVLGQGHCL